MDLESKGMHAVAVSRVHPVHLGPEPREGPERGGHVVEDDVAGRGARWSADARQRMAQQERGFLQAPGRQRPEGVVGFDGDREGEHLDEHAERTPGLRRRTPVDRGVEAKFEVPADPVEPADEQCREQREPRHAFRQARESCLAAEPIDRARTALVEFEREAGARRADGIRAAAVEGNRPARSLPARPPVFQGARARGRSGRQGRHRRIVGGQRWRPRAVAAQQALVLGTDLAVQQVGRPGIGDQVVLVQIPPGPAVTEPHEDAVDQVAAKRQRTGAALTAPLAELPVGIGSRVELDHLGRPPALRQRPPRVPALVVHDPGPERVAGVDDPLPGLAEQVGAKLRGEDERERHVVERTRRVEPLADPDLLLAVRQLPRRGRGIARPVQQSGIAHGPACPARAPRRRDRRSRRSPRRY